MVWFVVVTLALLFCWTQRKYLEAKGEPPVLVPRWLAWLCGALVVGFWGWVLIDWLTR